MNFLTFLSFRGTDHFKLITHTYLTTIYIYIVLHYLHTQIKTHRDRLLIYLHGVGHYLLSRLDGCSADGTSHEA